MGYLRRQGGQFGKIALEFVHLLISLHRAELCSIIVATEKEYRHRIHQ
jgi:hypothetical protein